MQEYWLVIVVLIAAANVAVFGAVLFVLWRWMSKRVPAPVRRRGQANALIVAIGVIALLGVLVYGVSTVFSLPLRESFYLALGVFWILTFVAFIASWLHAKSVAGALLLDCGPHPTKSLFLVNGAFFLILFAGGGLVSLIQQVDVWGAAATLVGISFAVYWVMMARGRLQVRENGLWQYWGLLRWDRLQHYEWRGESLLVRARSRIPLLGHGALPVPPEHKDALEAFLQTHCPNAGAT